MWVTTVPLPLVLRTELSHIFPCLKEAEQNFFCFRVGKNWQDILVLMMKCWLLLPFHPKEGTQQIKVFQSQSYDSFPFQLARTEVIIPTFIFKRRVFFSSVFLKSNVAALFSYNMVQSFDSTNGRNEH